MYRRDLNCTIDVNGYLKPAHRATPAALEPATTAGINNQGYHTRGFHSH